jgi:hypothetical protein
VTISQPNYNDPTGIPTTSLVTHVGAYTDQEVATRIATSQRGVVNGVATLDSIGQIPLSQARWAAPYLLNGGVVQSVGAGGLTLPATDAAGALIYEMTGIISLTANATITIPAAINAGWRATLLITSTGAFTPTIAMGGGAVLTEGAVALSWSAATSVNDRLDLYSFDGVNAFAKVTKNWAAVVAASPPPTVLSSAASSITATSATIAGSVNPNGASTSYQFEWGLTTSYGTLTSSTSAGSGSSPVAVTANLTGLTAGATYHYRLTATNSGGTRSSTDATFTTTGVPLASSISDNFNDNSIASTWTTLRTVESSGQLVGTADGTGAPEILWNTPIKLTGSVIYWQAPVIVGTAAWGIGSSTWPDDRLEFIGLYPLGGGVWRFDQIIAGSFVGSTVDVTLAAGNWIRMSELGGTVFVDKSTDGANWANQGSVTPAGGTAPYVASGYLGATTIATTTGDKVSFDNLNVAPTATSPSVLIAEQVTNTARVSSNNGDNSWGGNQNRVVTISNGSTADGTYAIYQVSDGQSSADGLGGRTWQVRKRTATNTWTTIATGPTAGIEWGCASLCGDQATGRLWIANWKNAANYSNYTSGRPRIWSGIPNGTTFAPIDDQTAPLALYGINSIYSGTCILPDGSVMYDEAYGAGGATKAIEEWRRTAAGTWTHWVKSVATAGSDGKGGVWEYSYVLPDRQGGNGVWRVGTRGNEFDELAYTHPTFNGNSVESEPIGYLYDDVNAWHTTDASVATPTYTEHPVFSQHQQNTGTAQATYPECLSSSGGSFVDKEGRLHVLTQYTPNRATTGTTANPNPAVGTKVKHTVLSSTGALLSQADVSGLTIAFARFLENAAGSLFILGANESSSTATLYAVPNRASAATGTTWSLNLGAPVEYSGIHEAAVKSGNRISDIAEIGFISTGYNTYRYCKIQLPTG